MQSNNKAKISFPADLAQNAKAGGIMPYGAVTFSKIGISFKLHMLLMRTQLISKLIWRYCTKKTIPYSSIISIEQGKNWFNIYLKIITNEVNGSYYLSLPKNQESNLNLIRAFLERCVHFGYEDSSMETLLSEIQDAARSAKKEYQTCGIVGMLLGAIIGWYFNLWIAYFILIVTHFYVCASENKLLRLLNIGLIAYYLSFLIE